MTEEKAIQPEEGQEQPQSTVEESATTTSFDPRGLNLKPGLTVRVHQKIKETNAKGELKERVQIFEGRIIAIKHGAEPGATITVRKVSEGIGVEKIFPLFSPHIVNIEKVRETKIRRAKLYFLRDYKKRLKEKLIG
jgi:large subunit ribosomal protein L19